MSMQRAKAQQEDFLGQVVRRRFHASRRDRAAISIGLHRDPDRTPGRCTLFEAEERRRLFHSLFTLCVLSSSAVARTWTVFDLNMIDVMLPLDANDDEIEEAANVALPATLVRGLTSKAVAAAVVLAMTCLAFPNDPEIDLFPGLVHRAAAQMERHQAVSLISKKGAALLRFLLAKVATAAAAHVQEPIGNIKRARSTSTPFNLHRTNQYSSPFHPVQSYSTSSSELAPSEAPSTQASASSRRSAEKSTQAALDVDLSSFLGSDIFEFGSSTGEAQGVDFSFRCS
ncbi:hypothetical protein MVLG_05327 [Microbotryum lychnidis-dioicae p1A1 Lamole]|uniref:Xylanolytic transcriptional activator regulatory domain-containing protein n=1 Tax=Microbotryum lychnidis-dioicae (strain p1A1 Lamole / MvSl-1064) TaxID=683840 RepID=U5HDX2_USTV1|nr:hypothetical protein MVLG_05327 [Microbotryum lychnidis-dioicae p1A1 Lamole]|eukprot:KDE04228.1 hypothetical protein MVLG_05327 [Microbotryum lychnidis-dioicae p1A1 Lamole]